MFLKVINAAAVSAAFVLAIGASSLTVQAETGTIDAYDQARCAGSQEHRQRLRHAAVLLDLGNPRHDHQRPLRPEGPFA